MVNEAIGLAAFVVGTLALIVAIVGLVLALAMKFSTHQVTWKTLDEGEREDPFEEALNFEGPEELGANPNKKGYIPEDDDLVDLDDPSVTSGF